VREKGFTLIEILLAVFILGIVLTTVYASYTGTFRLIGETQSDAKSYGMARTTLERMTQDLEDTARWKGSFEFVAKPNFLQGKDFTHLKFRSRAHVAFGKNEPPTGIAVIEYAVEETDEDGVFALYRSDRLTLDADEDASPPPKYLLCDRIIELTYRFYDEKGEERKTWDSSAGEDVQKKKAPTIVEIRLALKNERNPDAPYLFMTRVRIGLAAGQ
jgi:prepilin-type N-terminal cleavage/methylation domain-containing protein